MTPSLNPSALTTHESHNLSLCKSALQAVRDLIHIAPPQGSRRKKVASVFPTLSSAGLLSQTSPWPVLQYLDSRNRQPLAVPCLRLAVRTCTTSLHKETRSCRPYPFPPLQRQGTSVVPQHHVATTSSAAASAIQVPTAARSKERPQSRQNLVCDLRTCQ